MLLLPKYQQFKGENFFFLLKCANIYVYMSQFNKMLMENV